MAAARKERVAENQAMFRVVNERVNAWPERHAAPPDEALMFYCECADTACFDRVWLTAAEYEAVRADSDRFAVVAGHVFPEAERVLETHALYAVVQKHADLRELLERIDPRKGAYS